MTHYSIRKKYPFLFLFIAVFALYPLVSYTQSDKKDSLLTEVTLKNAVDYAILHQPLIQQSLLDQEIVEHTIKTKLADMYPQLNFNYGFQHNFIIQTAVIGGNNVRLGVNNTSTAQFTFSQALFNKDVLLANKTKMDVRLQSSQVTSSNKIEIAVAVSKAFYDVLSTMQQINISGENIVRIERSLKDAFSQYQSGVADKIDYKRATIALNNTRANQSSNAAILQAKLAYLKSLMGYPENGALNILYDSTKLEKESMLDTLQAPDYRSRIEYRQLETQKRLLQYNVKYYKWDYLPTVSANGAYNLNYQDNRFSKLYTNNFPNSFAGIAMEVPLFQGGKRKENIHIATLNLQRNELEMINLKNEVNAGYSQALANYKSNFQNYLALKENIALAQEVYDVIQLQYRSGIKTYLEVITSETDLRTAQINYYTAIYQLLSSKIDVQKALGQINY